MLVVLLVEINLTDSTLSIMDDYQLTEVKFHRHDDNSYSLPEIEAGGHRSTLHHDPNSVVLLAVLLLCHLK